MRERGNIHTGGREGLIEENKKPKQEDFRSSSLFAQDGLIDRKRENTERFFTLGPMCTTSVAAGLFVQLQQ